MQSKETIAKTIDISLTLWLTLILVKIDSIANHKANENLYLLQQQRYQQKMANLEKLKITDENEDERTFLCGFRDWTPKCLQFFADIHWFLPFISIFSLVQGIIMIIHFSALSAFSGTRKATGNL